MSWILPAILAVIALSAEVAVACSCLPIPDSAIAELERHDNVFSGRVRSVNVETDEERNSPVLFVDFEVRQVWKGEEIGASTTVLTRPTGVECGFSFELGKEYLVYASWNNEAMRLGYAKVSVCSRTRLLSEAAGDLSELGVPTSIAQATWGLLKLTATARGARRR